MGEIFPRTTPDTVLPFTGERMTTDAGGQIEIEHLHRYFLARELCRNKRVCDVASGEGYGSALLAQVATSVVGVDVSAAASLHAAQVYRADNLRFVAADARHIPLSAASVDVVVSFETIEHMYEQEEFLAEVRRILRPGGVLIISTPDRDVYSPYDTAANCFHVRELTGAEFKRMLRSLFPHVACLSQRPLLGSAMLADEEASAEAEASPLTFERRGSGHFEVNTHLPRGLYHVAYASDRPLCLPSASLYIETSRLDTSVQHIAAARQEVASLENARTTLEARLRAAEATQQEAEARCLRIENEKTAALMAQAAVQVAEMETLRNELQACRDLLAHAENRRALAERQADRVLNSTFWRVTAPLRGFAVVLPETLRIQLRQAAKRVVGRGPRDAHPGGPPTSRTA